MKSHKYELNENKVFIYNIISVFLDFIIGSN